MNGYLNNLFCCFAFSVVVATESSSDVPVPDPMAFANIWWVFCLIRSMVDDTMVSVKEHGTQA